MKISVIIPVYNVEKYLNQCIDSVLGQTYQDLEIILVNDGSTDRSPEICEEYKNKDSRIKLIHQKNSGVSNARNRGIDNAKGEWITFIDSDDYISDNYFDAIKNDNKFDWVFLNADRKIGEKFLTFMNFESKIFDKLSFIKEYAIYPDIPGPWARFYQSKIINENRLRFNPELKFGEDGVFNIKYLQFCKNISTSHSAKYIYRDTESGLSKLKVDVKNDYLLFKEIKNEVKKYKAIPEFYNKTLEYPLGRYLRALYYDKNLSKQKRIEILQKEFEENYEILKQIYNTPKIRFSLVLVKKTGFYNLFDFILSKLSK